MNKKLISISLILVLILALFTGCTEKEKKNEVENKEKVGDKATDNKDEKSTEEVAAVDKKKVFVNSDWVKSVMDNKQEESKDYAILEVSWGSVDDSPEYKDGHIPGAIHVDTGSIEGEPLWNIKTAEEVEAAMLELGLTKDTTAILYGKDVSGTARVATAYLWAGIENVKILDGGLDKWKESGYEIETTINEPTAVSEFGTKVPAHPEYLMPIDEAKNKLENDENFKLVSIRSYPEFIGETSGYSYIDKAGEPRGAVWGKGGTTAYTMEDYTHEDGTYINLEEMKSLWSDLEFNIDNELSFYCGTGWRASIPFLIMYENGMENMTIYDGGWLEWQNHDDYPVQVGDPTKDDVVYTTAGELSDDKAAK